MVYVPVPPAASPRARALAEALKETIAEHRRRHPETEDKDVREALHLASFQGGASAGPKWVAISLGLALLLGGLVFLLSASLR